MHPFPTTLPCVSHSDNDKSDVVHNPNQPNLFMKTKRKRLAKACDACHKSKRRCDGTAPCSNCYYASKSCTYTDSSGRPVPAPRPFNPECSDSQPSSDIHPRSYVAICAEASRYNPSLHPTNSSSNNQAPATNLCQDDSGSNRKRIKNERGDPIPTEDTPTDGPISGPSMDRPVPVKLDHSLTRELTNLFFTHCHPARLIIHKPSFATALSHNQAPPHLIHAICALAAPLSKQSRIRTNPPRFAGKPFAQEAMSIMFDGAGRLVCDANLATAQALCLLQIHDIVTKDKNMYWNTRYHDLALQIVKSLGVYNPDLPLLTPLPAPEFIQASLEREAVRRIFWVIQMLDIMISIYFKRHLAISGNELRVRLPADETSFELAVHSTLPEYLRLPPIKMQYASEFGHLLRVLMIYAEVEQALDYLTGLKEIEQSRNPATLIHDLDQRIQKWSSLLPDHLNFSPENLSVQQSMFETSSNGGAWCYCCMHFYHASTFIALNNAQQILQGASSLKVGPQWATDMLDKILSMLGERGKHSLLMSAALWTYAGLCGRDDPEIHAMARDYEGYWGTRMLDLVQSWRSRMSPAKRQLHQFITSPQNYSQNASLKRRHPSQATVNSPPSAGQSPSRHSPPPPPPPPPHPPTRPAQHDVGNANLSRPTLHQSCDASGFDPQSHLSNQPSSVVSRRTQPSSTDASRVDLSCPPMADSMQVSIKRHSPTLSPPSSSHYLEDGHHPILNNQHWRPQSDGKDNVRPPASTSLLVSNTGQEVKHEGAIEGQGLILAREHSKASWDRDQHQMGYGDMIKKENGLPGPLFSTTKSNQQGATHEGLHGEVKGSQKTDSIGSNISGDGPQPLPSLKSSGLLLLSAPDKVTQQGQMRSNRMQPATPQKSSPIMVQQKQTGQVEIDVSRNGPSMATSGMPVGLQWLAHELR